MKKNTSGSRHIKCDPDEVSYAEIDAALAVLSGKWKMLVIWKLWQNRARFGELKKALAGITQHMLTATLRALETDGLVTRTVFAEVPPRVEYELTPHAKNLEVTLTSLKAWGKLHLARRARARKS